MGVLFTKYRCTINFEVLTNRMLEIQNANTDLEFISGNHVPLDLIGQFVQSQGVVREMLLERYNEEIDTYTAEGLGTLINAVQGAFGKSFHLIIDRNSRQLVGRLDATFVGTNARLETLFVVEGYGRRKLGKWLIGSALLHLQNKDNVKTIEANTDQHNEYALRSLKAFDFFHKYSIENFLNQIEQ